MSAAPKPTVVKGQRALEAAARTAELERLFAAHGGTLMPGQVVDAARAPESPLHGSFTWDDGEAAEKYRKVEAAALLRRTFVVTTLPGSNEPRYTRIAVSLLEDRKGGPGYRPTSAVLADADRRQRLVALARMELEAFVKKYRAVSELAGIVTRLEAELADLPPG